MDDLLGAPNGPSNGAQDPMAFMAPAGGSSPGGAADPFAGMGGAQAAPSISQSPAPAAAASNVFAGADANDKVRAWEKKKDAEMKLLAEKEMKAKEERRRHAQSELEDFYKRRKETIEADKRNNRREEAEEKQKLKSGEQGKNPWEKVLNLCTDPKAGDEKAIDTTRFKNLLMHLKTEPVPN